MFLSQWRRVSFSEFGSDGLRLMMGFSRIKFEIGRVQKFVVYDEISG